MIKLLLLIIFITSLAAGYFVFFRHLESVRPYISPASSLPEAPIGDTLGLLSKKREDLIDQTEQTKQDITDSLFAAAQDKLNNLFDKPKTTLEVSVIPSSSVATSPLLNNTDVIEINFSQQSNNPIKIKKGVKYSLVFKNTPADYCIYIQEIKYPIGDSQILLLQINESGNYPIKANSCQTDERDIGQLSVE